MFGGLTSGTHRAPDPQQRPIGPVASGREQWVAMWQDWDEYTLRASAPTAEPDIWKPPRYLPVASKRGC